MDYEGVLMPPHHLISHPVARVLGGRSQDNFVLHILRPRGAGPRGDTARALLVSLSSVVVKAGPV